MIRSIEDMEFKHDLMVGTYVDEVTIKYVQNEDCTRNMEDCQEIILSTRDGGGGRFINIKTESWSISDIKELEEIINDFKIRAGVTDEHKDEENGDKEL